ncbi:hypothetical protein ACQR1I_29180 [Bradyrhizobium sp. HKCCYLS2038]|uniref:hypothetical protein n=1 Tax=unclassified Bradyrhizobium TaxID=2631580 RepID=UPI003EB988ED
MIEQPPKYDWTLALSVSETPDLAALGMFENDDKRVLSAVLTPLVYRGARIAYGGRIDPPTQTNFTLEISTQLAAAYRSTGRALKSRPFIHYLRANDLHRKLLPDDPYREREDKVWAHTLRLGAFSEIKLLSGETTVATLMSSGKIADVYIGDRRLPEVLKSAARLKTVPQIALLFDEEPPRDGLAALRRAMARETDARIILGCRVAGSRHCDGTWWGDGSSGIAAEAVATLEENKPLIVIGGIGGASRDIAAELDLIDAKDQVLHARSGDPGENQQFDNYDASMKLVGGFADDYRARLEAAASGMTPSASPCPTAIPRSPSWS